MSYILDALRKSEQERRRTGAPDLTTEQRPSTDGGGRQRLLLGVLMLALAGNAALLGVWLLRSGEDPPATPTAGTADDRSSSPEATMPAGEEASPAGPTPAPMQDDASPVAAVEDRPATDSGDVAEPGAADPAAEPVSIHDLPERIRERIPPLRFSTHIYAEEAAWREVGINGRIHAEGARIQGMRLERITETGVILELDGWRFRVSVLENWDY